MITEKDFLDFQYHLYDTREESQKALFSLASQLSQERAEKFARYVVKYGYKPQTDGLTWTGNYEAIPFENLYEKFLSDLLTDNSLA